MRSSRRSFVPLTAALTAVVCAAAAAAALALGTTRGSALVFEMAVGRALEASHVQAASYRGSLLTALEAGGVKVVDARAAFGADFTVERAKVVFLGRKTAGLHLEADGIRADLDRLAPPGGHALGTVEAGALRLKPDGSIRIKDLEWSGSGWLPERYAARAGTLILSTPLGPGSLVSLQNGRIQQDGQTILLIFADQENARDRVRISAPVIDLAEAASLLGAGVPALQGARGQLRELDLQALGADGTWDLEGGALLEEIRFQGCLIENCRIRTRELKLRLGDGGAALSGSLVFEGGRLRKGRTALDLESGSVFFSDEGLAAPRILIQASSLIDGVRVRLRVTGAADKPGISVSSSPAMPEERLYFMLFTGKRWKGLDSSVKSGRVSASLAGEMADYLFFGGKGERIAGRLGIKDWSVTTGGSGTGASVDLKVAEDAVVSIEGQRKSAAGGADDDGRPLTGGADTNVNLQLKKVF